MLAASRETLSQEACTLLDALAKLEAEDYRRPAEHAVHRVVAMMQRYAEPDRQRAEIEAGASASAEGARSEAETSEAVVRPSLRLARGPTICRKGPAMLDFEFSPTQVEYREQLRDLALRELLPGYQQRDEEGRYPADEVRRIVGFSDAFWKGREDERDLVSVGITAEEVARGDFNCVLPSLGPAYQSQFFADLSAEQKERWMPGLLAGDQVIALCITEPAAGSDMGRLEARAEWREDRWVIDGVKNSVSFLNADVFYVFARTDPDARGWQGISAFLLPRDTPGMSFEEIDDLGCRSIPRGIVRFDGVEAGPEAMVGEPGTAFVRISRFFDVNRAVIGLKCVGAALQTVDETVAHARERVVFGAPMAAHQAVTFPLAEAATHLELARWQCYRVLWMRQRGLPCQSEGAMVKWWAPKMAAEAIHKCLLFHGHRGFSRELPIQQRLRDVIGWQIGDGSEEVMKLIIVRGLFAEG